MSSFRTNFQNSFTQRSEFQEKQEEEAQRMKVRQAQTELETRREREINNSFNGLNNKKNSNTPYGNSVNQNNKPFKFWERQENRDFRDDRVRFERPRDDFRGGRASSVIGRYDGDRRRDERSRGYYERPRRSRSPAYYGNGQNLYNRGNCPYSRNSQNYENQRNSQNSLFYDNARSRDLQRMEYNYNRSPLTRARQVPQEYNRPIMRSRDPLPQSGSLNSYNGGMMPSMERLRMEELRRREENQRREEAILRENRERVYDLRRRDRSPVFGGGVRSGYYY